MTVCRKRGASKHEKIYTSNIYTVKSEQRIGAQASRKEVVPWPQMQATQWCRSCYSVKRAEAKVRQSWQCKYLMYIVFFPVLKPLTCGRRGVSPRVSLKTGVSEGVSHRVSEGPRARSVNFVDTPWETRRPPREPPMFNHPIILKVTKTGQKVPKSYFCHFLAYFWPILGSTVFFCPVEGRVVLKTLRGRSPDTFGTLQSPGPEGPLGHLVGHPSHTPVFGDTLTNTPQDPSESCSWSAWSQGRQVLQDPLQGDHLGKLFPAEVESCPDDCTLKTVTSSI